MSPTGTAAARPRSRRPDPLHGGGQRSVQRHEPDDPIATYLSSVARLPTLDAGTQLRLLRAYRASRDPAVARQLVMGNLRLVVKIASEYRRSGADLRDLVQEGVLGLMRAVEKFDLDQGVKLSTYAALWIRAHLLRYVTRNWRQVKIGTTQAQRRIFFNLPEELRRIAHEDEGESAAAIIARRLQVKPEEVESLMQRLSTRELSLDAPIDRQGGGITHVDQLAAEDSWRPDLQAEAGLMEERLRECVTAMRKELDPRETLILDGRWLADDAMTLEALARRLGLTREGVRQIERRVLRRLKERLGAAGPEEKPLAA